MPTVELSFSPLPAHVRTARLVAVAVARRSGVEESLLDEVRLAVGEACSRAVGLHARHCPDEPVMVELEESDGHFRVTVHDHVADADGSSAASAGALEALENVGGADLEVVPLNVGLAVIRGLVDDVEVVSDDDGEVVRMTWPLGSG